MTDRIKRHPGAKARTSADRRYTILKRALLAALILYAWLVVGANSARDVDFDVIALTMADDEDVGELLELDGNAFQERFTIAPEGCEGWLLYGADEVMDVSELMIAKGGEEALTRLESAAQARLDAQLEVFRSYGVGQTQLLKDAVLLRRGQYLFYGVGASAREWEDLFLACIR